MARRVAGWVLGADEDWAAFARRCSAWSQAIQWCQVGVPRWDHAVVASCCQAMHTCHSEPPSAGQSKNNSGRPVPLSPLRGLAPLAPLMREQRCGSTTPHIFPPPQREICLGSMPAILSLLPRRPRARRRLARLLAGLSSALPCLARSKVRREGRQRGAKSTASNVAHALASTTTIRDQTPVGGPPRFVGKLRGEGVLGRCQILPKLNQVCRHGTTRVRVRGGQAADSQTKRRHTPHGPPKSRRGVPATRGEGARCGEARQVFSPECGRV